MACNGTWVVTLHSSSVYPLLILPLPSILLPIDPYHGWVIPGAIRTYSWSSWCWWWLARVKKNQRLWQPWRPKMAPVNHSLNSHSVARTKQMTLSSATWKLNAFWLQLFPSQERITRQIDQYFSTHDQYEDVLLRWESFKASVLNGIFSYESYPLSVWNSRGGHPRGVDVDGFL